MAKSMDSEIGAVLRENVDRIKNELGLSTLDVCCITGLSRQGYSYIFKRPKGPVVATVIRLAEALECDPGDLLRASKETDNEDTQTA